MKSRLTLIVAIGALMVAAFSATNQVGGWNDASRLATVESLVDRHTWVIDDSIFVTSPNGTQDKLFIDGHFYSDKSPVPALMIAASYNAWRWFGGPAAADRPDLFCRFMSFVWAGGAFVVAVLGIDRLAYKAHLPTRFRMLIVASFAFGTIALPYSRSVNNHILLLAVTTWLLVLLDQSNFTFNQISFNCCQRRSYRDAPVSPIVIGTLAGVAYTIDLGAGPVICLVVLVTSTIRHPSWSVSMTLFAAALPWIIFHHALNYHIGGTIGPANANPEFFRWPGCPFNETNLTGGWPHRSIWAFVVYAMDMLIGKKGLFTHQPQLWLAVAAVVVLMKQRSVRISMILLTAGWCTGVWLLYAASSRNMSGQCVSVRWLVPLLAPAYYWLIHAVKFRPEVWKDLAVLSGAGAVINLTNWYRGPWNGQTGAVMWIAVAIAGISWGYVSFDHRRRPSTIPLPLRHAA